WDALRRRFDDPGDARSKEWPCDPDTRGAPKDSRAREGSRMDPTLPEELVMLQRSVREFVEKRLVPLEREIEEKDEIPRSLIEAMAGMGLFGLGFSEKVGGQGFGKLGYCVAVEQLARANASLWNVVGGSAGLCGTAISVGGPDDVRHRYLPDLFSGRRVGAYALSEPGAGSDAGSLKTAARRD